MINIKDAKECMGCEACVQGCPVECISMNQDIEGFNYPNVDNSKCIKCKKCIRICPMINPNKNNKKVKVYACINKNKKILKESSSGGIFSLLAEHVIKKNGVVFGAKFDNNFKVVHDYINNVNDLHQLRGSKYVQSNINISFKKAKEILDNGVMVLFSGTPCQIIGLKRYLNKEYLNLITCDFICTGVPSPKLFNGYIEFIKNNNLKEIKGISFRDKKISWNHFGLKVDMDRKKYFKVRYLDPYIQGQYNHLTLRPACYNCKFKEMKSGSDIKLGDYWGVSKVHRSISEKEGVSIVFIGSDKGNNIFNDIKNNIEYIESSYEHAVNTNRSFTEIVKEPSKRKEMFKEIELSSNAEEVYNILKKYTYKTRKERYRIYSIIIRSKVKELIR